MLRSLVINSRSYRSFDESKTISEETLREIVDTVRLCPSAVNRQPLKYKLCTDKTEVEKVMALTAWAGLLKDITLPPEGHHPTAFVIICHDTTVSPDPKSSAVDVGIAAQTMMLAACEMGYGGCMIGAFDPDRVGETVRISAKYHPVLLVALGVPDEAVFITEIGKDGDTRYFRDKAGIHYVPKRAIDSVIID
ncbi:MAG: nitroreductase [Ruminococcaceae bacterium]|nr:nitroreductase [Oscillospiraceae bacterium]